MRKNLSAGLAFIMLAALALAGCGEKDRGAEKARFPEILAAGKEAVDFQTKDMNGAPVRLSANRGRVVILFFWRMKCPECKASMPSLDALGRRFRDKGLVVMAFNEDSMHSSPKEAVEAFLEKERFSFVNVREEDGYVAEAYSVFKAPQAFVIAGNGLIAAVKDGPTDWMSADNAGMIEGLLHK